MEDIEKEKTKEGEEGDILISIATKILSTRLDTTPEENKYDYYRKKIQKNLEFFESGSLPQGQNGIYGTLCEALFYHACKESLPIDIEISNGQEDYQGIDFFLITSSNRFAIDVTTNQDKFPAKLKKSKKVAIMLPEENGRYGILNQDPKIDLKEYLLETFNLNMTILKNKTSKYLILVSDNKQKDIYRRKDLNICNNKPKYSEQTKRICLKKQNYEKILSVVSILKNFTP